MALLSSRAPVGRKGAGKPGGRFVLFVPRLRSELSPTLGAKKKRRRAFRLERGNGHAVALALAVQALPWTGWEHYGLQWAAGAGCSPAFLRSDPVPLEASSELAPLLPRIRSGTALASGPLCFPL